MVQQDGLRARVSHITQKMANAPKGMAGKQLRGELAAEKKEVEAEMARLLKAFKNPRQGPPRFHYRAVNEQHEVINEGVAEDQMVVTVHGVQALQGGAGRSTYVVVEVPFSAGDARTPQSGKSGEFVARLRGRVDTLGARLTAGVAAQAKLHATQRGM